MNSNPIALARQYRPRMLSSVVGQASTVQALSNALATGRLHHAYLFTGTRGVGKTSLARILAKCLQCEQGISPTPCGTCATCLQIDEGRSVDVLEVDAASRTKVEDTRDLLDNVQYLPARSRFKIYLIDEVHMLSTHSFNALLKTLEEPPAHVKFLLATTDPQKLPPTILSRCLQFHLHRLPFHHIVEHLRSISQSEQAKIEEEALRVIAHAADGSMRDALSLLDQAIAYGKGCVETSAVHALLGIAPKDQLLILLEKLALRDGPGMLAVAQAIHENDLDFKASLDLLITLLHQMALVQQWPDILGEEILERDRIRALAERFPPEEVQLYYQIALYANRDLPYAPNARMGFEMALLRMLAFQPVDVRETEVYRSKVIGSEPSVAPSMPMSHEIPTIAKVVAEVKVSPPNKEPNKVNESFGSLLPKLPLTGLVKELAHHCAVVKWAPDFIHLELELSHSALLNKRNEERLAESIRQQLGNPDPFRFKITLATPSTTLENTPAKENERQQQAANNKARKLIESNPNIQNFMQVFNAEIEEATLLEKE